ncbi:MAG: tetratricopeptide repeat protein [Nitrospirota bacterium]
MLVKNCKIVFSAAFCVFIFAISAFGLLDNWSHYYSGLKYIKEKNYKAAEDNFNYYLRHPEMHRHMFGVAYFGRGIMFQDMNNYSRAVEEYKMAIENDLNPTAMIKDKAYMNIGTIYMGKKKYKDAKEAYLKAVESNSRNGLAHYYLGLAYLRAGEYEQAEKESEEAKKLGITFTALSDELNKVKGAAQNKGKIEKVN